MPFIKALILGIVEGLTEFLPISSTGHLIIVGDLLDQVLGGGGAEQDKVFKIVIQLGAILAVCWFYRARLIRVARGIRTRPTERRFAFNIIIAFLPAMVAGVLFHDVIKTYLFSPLTVAGALIIGGFVILYIEHQPPRRRVRHIDDLSTAIAFKVGLAQTLALFPGVSRAGATIMGGVVFGLSRQVATELSFFLAIPTMLAATAYDVFQARDLLTSDAIPLFAVGFIAAFISAALTIKTLLHYVANHDFVIFAWYRIGFGVLVLFTALTGLITW
ncbi:undecaprenyl-diphosphate phosphatase [Rhodoferax sp. 4810]|uniref:Undecaprenyl-diphosphatase n=1 Tax=Thiospirillum jenense TaxID=1653858 RepID=A0A839H3Y1_9GAMM|nr:undecaprenyl-diphosphate phosphatase [Rhodoferax jenense]MBB1124631.1 undecaprenyl-diphosphate phosphatase [Thiospirillum jenense]